MGFVYISNGFVLLSKHDHLGVVRRRKNILEVIVYMFEQREKRLVEWYTGINGAVQNN